MTGVSTLNIFLNRTPYLLTKATVKIAENLQRKTNDQTRTISRTKYQPFSNFANYEGAFTSRGRGLHMEHKLQKSAGNMFHGNRS